MSEKRKVENKTVTRTVDTTQTDAIGRLLENSGRLRELTTELETLALQHVKDVPTEPDPRPAYPRQILGELDLRDFGV